ncbi:glycosyltransferase [Jannaschia ovalis]|uniref:Glycosyltransferase n=1 Tax=Jannaschia ovalis TaxID=3038773 RepID=A0ABY8LA30_9RHOB|nr:glycosyltransferase [Jannaschia sp. GRR-S6-38]WGH78207.1 glycosyltransferase [Jannaschia sp. GRR-S6-38]
MSDDMRTPPLPRGGVSRLPGLEGRIPDGTRAAVVLTTIGSLGDLYPVLSLARALEVLGVEARLALSPEDCDMARRWGLLATPVGPSQAEVCAALGVTRDEVAAQILHDPGPLISKVAIPMLPEMVEALRPLCVDAAAVTGTTFALNAPLAAELAGKPYVPLTLQPMLTLSALDPPRARGFGLAVRAPQGAVARAWNRALMTAGRGVLTLRHRRGLNRVRAGMGLPRFDGTPLLDHAGDVPLRLGHWSERFAPLPADAHPDLRLTGFPPPPVGDLPDALAAFLDAGPAPLVVTLGSIAQGLNGPDFWQEAVAMARAMGLRAVLLHGAAEVPGGPDLMALPYAPHAPLFPRAAAILHHGGMGTSAEALRSGRPQLVVPVGGDQPDNAARLADLGVAVTLSRKNFDAEAGEAALTGLLSRFDYPGAAELGEEIAAEDGAATGAALIAGIMRLPQREGLRVV